MTIAQKRKKLDMFCETKEVCLGCPLCIPELKCGRGEHFSVKGEGRMTDESVELAYSIAFPDTKKDCHDDLKKALEENKRLTEENARLEEDVLRLRAEKETLEIYNKHYKFRAEETQKFNDQIIKRIEELVAELNECVQIKSDAVREVQKELERRIHTKLAYQGWYLKETVIPNVIKVVLRGCEDESIT